MKRLASIIALCAALGAAALIMPGAASAFTGTFSCPIHSVSKPYLSGGVKVDSYNLQCNGDSYYAYGELRVEINGRWVGAYSGGQPACVYWPGGTTHCVKGDAGYAADGSHHIWGPHTYSVLTDRFGNSLAPYCAYNFRVILSWSSKTTDPATSQSAGGEVTSATLTKTC